MPSHATPHSARVGDTRADLAARKDGGHTAGHVGKGGSQPASLSRRDNDRDLQPPDLTPRPESASVVVGENPGVIGDKRR
jgi:hypothetical protein